MDPVRKTIRRGSVVRWANSVGMRIGQSGEWVFRTEEDAQRFAEYAGDGFPSLSDEALRDAGVPLPVEKRSWL